MTDDRDGPGGHAPRMRTLRSAVLLLLLVTGCAPEAALPAPPAEQPAASTDAPAATPRATEPSTAPAAAPSALPTAPPPQTAPLWAAFPTVRLVPGAFPISAPQPLVEVPLGTLTGAIGTRTEQTAQLKQLGEWWWSGYVTVLNRVAAADTPETRSQLAQWHPGKAYADYLRRWLYGPEGTRTFEAGSLEIERILAKPWGRLAMVEARMTLVAHSSAKDETRTQRVRIVPHAQGMWYVLDGYDERAGRWLAGDAPFYTARTFEAELPAHVASYLQNESYVPGGQKAYAWNGSDTRFWTLRRAAIDELNARFEVGTLVDRHFEGLTLAVVRVDNTTFVGDGVATVRLAGTLVEIDGKGTRTAERFTQLLKFYRQPSAFGAAYYAVDAQEDDGSWDSGGDLAIGLVDRRYG